MKLRIAVTGATGFVGTRLVAALSSLGHGLVAVGRCAPGEGTLPPGVDFVQVDFEAPRGDLYELLGRPDALCHLAWPDLANHRAVVHLERHAPVHAQWLRALIEQGLPRLLVTGTCFEYGMQDGCLDESRCTDPCTAYGLGKDVLRRHLQLLQPEHRFSLRWARLFYLWGDQQPRSTLFSQLKCAAEAGLASFPMSAGEQLRDYLTVERAGELLAQLVVHPNAEGIYNVCAGQPTSVRALVEGWIASHGWTIRPELGRYPYPAHEPLAFWGSDRRLRSLLGT